jgi:hypothetical protein
VAEHHAPAHAHDDTVNPAVSHETTDVNVRGVFGFAAGLIITGVLIHFAVWVLFDYFDARERARSPRQYPLAAAEQTRLPPEPRLQTDPRADLNEFRARENTTLTTYGWIDRNGGVVRIPIDRAMKIVVERGLPARNTGDRK